MVLGKVLSVLMVTDGHGLLGLYQLALHGFHTETFWAQERRLLAKAQHCVCELCSSGVTAWCPPERLQEPAPQYLCPCQNLPMCCAKTLYLCRENPCKDPGSLLQTRLPMRNARAQPKVKSNRIVKYKWKGRLSCGFFKHLIELDRELSLSLRNDKMAVRTASIDPAPIKSNWFHIY